MPTGYRFGIIAGSLQVARGRVVAEALAHAAPGDLMVVGKWGGSPLRTGRLGSTARGLLGQASLSVMVMERAAAGSHPTVALFDHPEWGPRALEMAAQIARRDGRALAVLLPPGKPEAVADLRRSAETWLAARGLQAEFRTLAAGSPRAVASAVAAADGRALVISRQSPYMADGTRLIEAVAPPVVVVP